MGGGRARPKDSASARLQKFTVQALEKENAMLRDNSKNWRELANGTPVRRQIPRQHTSAASKPLRAMDNYRNEKTWYRRQTPSTTREARKLDKMLDEALEVRDETTTQSTRRTGRLRKTTGRTHLNIIALRLGNFIPRRAQWPRQEGKLCCPSTADLLVRQLESRTTRQNIITNNKMTSSDREEPFQTDIY